MPEQPLQRERVPAVPDEHPRRGVAEAVRVAVWDAGPVPEHSQDTPQLRRRDRLAPLRQKDIRRRGALGPGGDVLPELQHLAAAGRAGSFHPRAGGHDAGPPEPRLLQH